MSINETSVATGTAGGAAGGSFDRAALLDRCMGSPQLAKEILGKCLAQLEQNMPLLRSAAEASRLAEVRQIAHKLRGSTGAVGASRLSESLAALESLASSESARIAPEQLAGIKSEVDELVASIRHATGAGGPW